VDARYTLRVGWEQGEPAGTLITGHIYRDGKEVMNQSIVLKTLQDRAIAVTGVPVTQGPRLFEVQMEVAPDAQQPKPLRGLLPYPTSVFAPPGFQSLIGPRSRIPGCTRSTSSNLRA
jgi:hypothetical protein